MYLNWCSAWLLHRSSLHTLPLHLLLLHDAPARLALGFHTPPTPSYSAGHLFFPSVKFFASLSITQASLVLPSLIAKSPNCEVIVNTYTFIIILFISGAKLQPKIDFVFFLLARHNANEFAFCSCFVRQLTTFDNKINLQKNTHNLL